MNPLKSLWRAARKPFNGRRHPRIVVNFRRREDNAGVVVNVRAEGTFHADEYELKCMAVFLFALSRGLEERAKEVGEKETHFLASARHAFDLASILLFQARGEI